MQTFDWILVSLPLLLILAVGLYARRFVTGVTDFLASRRMAGRYLLTIAGSEMQAGAVVFVASFESISRSGFVMTWWGHITVPIMLIVAITGFVGYRLRETRVMTLAQFFEIRYSKGFRLFTGVMGFVSGIVNFGIIPAIGSRCLVYVLGLPVELHLGTLTVPTYMALMAGFLSVSLFIALSGGLVSVMLVNCVEGMVGQLLYLVIIAALLVMFDWSQISSVLASRPPGESMLNPFDSLGTKDFNLWLAMIGVFVNIYGTNAWQNAGGYRGAAVTPHEGRMAGILGRWLELGKGAVVTLLGICALTFMQHPDFAQQAAGAHEALAQIGNARLQTQMESPIALAHMLPAGVRGALCLVLLMGIFGGDATHLHSWGSIFVQDVLVPLRKKPFGSRQHLLALRCAIFGVAVFAFLFGCLFRQTEYVFMWWSVSAAIYLGGAGAAIIGGLYWNKGTAAAAWAGMITGSSLAVGGIVARQVFEKFPLNGAWISFGAAVSAIAVYVTVSLLTCRENFNLDRMLHRGAYAGAGQAQPKSRVSLGKLIGLDENFTRGDKWVACLLFGWGLFWSAVVIVSSLWNGVSPWSLAVWSSYWHIAAIVIPVVLAAVTGVWFAIGGLLDMRRLFARLRQSQANPLDDGTVVNNQNLDEYELTKNKE